MLAEEIIHCEESRAQPEALKMLRVGHSFSSTMHLLPGQVTTGKGTEDCPLPAVFHDMASSQEGEEE